ncbi:MAG TPA: glycosyltransferase family 87 protein [Solirubrobacteraceae bacterium]|nr:glycosyltransferase family 87 protein [Solirubrobacteraceae bacterium]
MSTSSAHSDKTELALSSGSPRPDGTVALPSPLSLGGRLSISLPRSARGPLPARIALGSIVLLALLLVAATTAAPTPLVTHSYEIFPFWESGPLHYLFSGLTIDKWTLDVAFSYLMLAMLAAYAVALYGVRTLSLRTIVVTIVALHVILFFGPPTPLNDVFNYLGYARLGGLHHLNPYTHVMYDESWDPVYIFSSWRHLNSPYGTLFSAITYPLGLLPLAAAYWVWKLIAVLGSLGLLWMVYKIALTLGRDPRHALVFLALNPLYLVFALGGFHNDFVMLIPSMAAVLLTLKGRQRSAGAVLMLSVAIKYTTVILLPFLLVAARPEGPAPDRRVWLRRSANILFGCLLGAIPLIAISVGLFGFSLPSVANQARLLTPDSIPNLVGFALGADGGATWVLDLADLLLVGAVLALMFVVKGDWISRAGWGALALVLSLGWLMPWYVIWAAPLAALGTSARLRKAILALTVFLVITFIPITNVWLSQHGIDPMNSAVGRAASSLTNQLEQ